MTPDITFSFTGNTPSIDDILLRLKEHCDCMIYFEEEGYFSNSKAFSVRTVRGRKLHVLYSDDRNEIAFLPTFPTPILKIVFY